MSRPAPQPGRLAWWSALAALCAVLVAPLLIADVPPLGDYPNHLARAFILADGGRDPILAQMYVAHWAVIPNLAVDILLPPLIKVLPVHVAGRLMIAVTILLPVAGALLLSHANFGRRSWWSLGVVGVACNELFLLGFLNFQLSVGVALMAAACWVRWRETRPGATVAAGAAFAVLLFFSHLAGLAMFLVLAGSHELAALWRVRFRGVLARVGAFLPVLILPVPLFLHSAFSDKAAEASWQTVPEKLMHAITGLLNYSLPLDVLTTAALAVFLLSCLWTGHLLAPGRSCIALGVFALCYAVAPIEYKGTGYLDVRFAVMAGFVLFTATLPVGLGRRSVAVWTGAFLVLFAARTLLLVQAWVDHRQNLGDLRDVMALVEPGSRVLSASVWVEEATVAEIAASRRHLLSNGAQVGAHLAALLPIERRAFWPLLFANPEQQPIELLQPYREIARRANSMPNVRQLSARSPDPRDRERFGLSGQWSCCFDYVLLMEAETRPGFTVEPLELLRLRGGVALYRIATHVALAP